MSAGGGAFCLVLFLFVSSCSAVIYHLNESEYSRMPPLYGLDDFGRCLVPAGGLYCVVRLDLFANTTNPLLTLIREYSEGNLKHYNHTYLQRGVCVTSTCRSHIGNNSIETEGGLAKVLEECLNETIYSEYGIQAKLTTMYSCDRKTQQIDIDLADWIVLGVYAVIVLVNCIGTLYDVVISRSVRDTKGNKFLLSFSIIQNWRRLTSKESEEVRAKSLMALHGAKVLTIFIMLTAHVMWLNTMGFSDNVQEFEELYENVYYQIIFNGMIVVQVFFVISGFLLTYNLETYAEKNYVGWMLVPKLWLMRWWRLTPAYAAVLAFMTSWLRHLGSGPLWRMFVAHSVVADCRRYWWAHMLYINNYISDDHACAVHTWYIAAEMQLFCVGLVVLAATGTRRAGRRGALAVLAALGVMLPAANVYLWDLDALVLVTPEFFRTMWNDTYYYMHVYGHNNMASYAIGMCVANLARRMRTARVRARARVDLANNKVCIALTWLVVPSIVAVFYSGSVFYAEGARAPLAGRVAYAALHRPLVGLLVGFLLLGATMKFNTFIIRFFEARVWVVPSRLSYSVYLLHLIVIHTALGMKTQLGHVSTYTMIIFHFGVMMLTYAIALPFYLMLEAPLMALMKSTNERPQEGPEQTKF